MSLKQFKQLHDIRQETYQTQREIEAEAMEILRHRSTFFALKLLLGVPHKAVKPETQEPEATEQVPQPV